MLYNVQKRGCIALDMSDPFTGTFKLWLVSEHDKKMWRIWKSVLNYFLSFHLERDLMDPRDGAASCIWGKNSFMEKEFLFLK